jgi:hypothetical protein
MTTQNTPAQTEQPTPSLKDLIGFDLPKLTRHYSDTITYTLDCDEKNLNDLKTAATIAAMTLHDGIGAISDLLLTVAINCPSQLNKWSQIHALALVYELNGALKTISDTEFFLDKAQAAQISEVAK